ncbi:RNA polymerase II transcription factor [Kwoniella heveanensis CBS 569]|uniref:RNA polymerase II transcription factor n=1 Tax=Kwoniella heveanensis BCC8398 TaxID=1296120 RepID=A0A1B9GI22_9TREE|nr:RNA polymerase II transcription factor [Kwoniella heveanensis BCC8398]OCF38684.1 RNA polymerase II transcription factor [Kwoniella heveanensis CBS 569]
MSFLRDSQPLVVHCDSDVARAVYGIGELFSLPTVTLRACYAVPSSSSTSAEITNANPKDDGNVPMAEGAANTNANGAVEESSRLGWLVGEDLANAEKEEGFESKYEVRYPFRASKAADDWDGREFVLSHLLNLVGIKIPTNASSLLLVPPPSPPTFPLSTQALYTQLAFESLNTPLFSILPSPLASIYALGATSGLILHVGWEESYVFVVTDSVVRWECSTTIQVGEKHCQEFLERLLLEDELLDAELKAATEKSELSEEEKRKLIREVSEVLWRECTGDDVEVPLKGGKKKGAISSEPDKEDESFDVAKKLVGDNAPPANPSHKSKKQQAQAAAAAAKSAAAAAEAAAIAAASAPIDAIVINVPSLPSKEIQLGPVRHRLCEPLFNGKEAGGDTIWEGVGRALENASLSLGEKLSLWENVGVVGQVARVKSFPPALITYLAPYLLSSTDLTTDRQPSKARLLNIPEYFANFKNSTGDLAPFLGGSLVARVAFSDAQGRHCISKVDYNANGPAAIYNVTADGQ